jgi:hypothetical protein
MHGKICVAALLALTAACHNEEGKEEAEAPAPVQLTAVLVLARNACDHDMVRYRLALNLQTITGAS